MGCDAARRIGDGSSAVPRCTRAGVAGEVLDSGSLAGQAGEPPRSAHPIMLASFARTTEVCIAATTMATGSTAPHEQSRAAGARDRPQIRSLCKAACSETPRQTGIFSHLFILLMAFVALLLRQQS